MSESAKSAKSAKQIFANFVKFVKPFFGTTRCSVGSVTEAEYPTNYQRISNLSLTIRPFRVAILAVLLVFVGGWNSEVWGNSTKNEGGAWNHISSNSVSWVGNHVTFKIAGSKMSYGSTLGGYLSLSKNQTYTISWKANTGCTITVTSIEANLGNENIASYNVSGTISGSVGGWSTKSLTASNLSLVGNSSSATLKPSRDARLYYMTITYTIKPDAPTIKAITETVNVSLTNENKLDMTTLIGVSDVSDFMPVSFGSNSFNDPLGVSTTGAYTFSGKNFYATKAGVYTFTNPYIAAKSNCHEKSASTTGTITITVNRLNQTLTMSNGSVNVTTDKANPTKLDLSTLCSQVGNGTVTYSLVSGPTSLGGDAATDNCSISGKNFYAWVGGTYTLRASAPATAQYNAATPKDFTVTVNRLTQTISWTPANLEIEPFVEEDVVTATSIGNVTLAKSGTGADYISITDNIATILEVKANTTATLTATAAQTDVYAEATDSKNISLTSLTKQHITFTQNLTKLKTTDGTKKVQLVATSDSGRDSYITFEVSSNSAGVTVTHEGDKWYLNYTGTAAKGIMVTARLDGVEGVSVAASPVSQMVKVTDPTAKCDVTESLESAYGLKSTSKTYNLTIPKKVVLKIRCSEKSRLLLSGYDIAFYKGNTQVGETQSYGVTDGHYNNQDVKTRTFDNLDKDITKVVVTSNASKGYDITEASYERWSYANPSVSELNYEAQALSTVEDQTFTLDYANYQIELSIEGSSNFVLKSDDSFGECETYGSQTVKVGYNVPAEATEETAYLRIKDNTGTLLNTVTLHANVTGGLTQNITDHNIRTSYWTTDLVNLTATTDRGLTNFSYSASPTGVAVFNGAQMTFTQSGTIAITVKEAGNKTYNEATATVENVKVNKVTPDIVNLPTGTAIPYKSTLSGSTLTGGSADVTLRGQEHQPVAGSYVWTEPTHVVTDAAGSHSYAVTFNPQNTGMYNPNTTGSISINITRATQALTMNDGTVKVAVGGIDAGAADSKIDLDDLIASQTGDVVNNVKRDGAVTYEVISSNKANATIGEGNIFSATVCGTYTIRATKAETNWYNVVTKEFTVTVEKRGNTLTTTATYTKFVDDVISTVVTIVNSDGTIHTSTSDGTIAYYDVAQNKIFIPNSEAKSFNSTTVIIKIWQDATERFEGIAEANAKVITLTIKKYDNPFACSWGSFAKTVNFDEVVPTELTTQNSDYTHFPIEIEQTSGEKIATLVRNDNTNNTITASHLVGDATWHMTQAESYKYKASEADLSLSVRVIGGENCYMFEDNTEHEFKTKITDGSGHYDDPIAVSGPVNKLYFEAKRDILAVSKFIVQYSVDNGSHWRTIANPDLSIFYEEFGPYEFTDLQANERVSHIRFGATVGGTLSKYYKNIKISRTTNIQPLDADGNHITTLTMPTSTVDGSTTAQFYLNYSSCDDIIKIVSNNAHFSVDKAEISVDHSKDFNNATITVTYHSSAKGKHTGTITIYTKYQNETLTVIGETDKKIQTLTWEEGYTENTLSLPVGLEINNVNYVVSASSGNAVIYTTDNPEIIEIIQGGLGFKIIGEGTARLTATQAGNDDWFPVSESKTINATFKKIQEIVWTQDFIRNMELRREIDLDAKVYIRDVAKGMLTYSASQTALLTYSCPTNTVIALDKENKKITVLGYGQTSITASLPTGSEVYEDAAPVTLIVKVRKPSEGCETPWIVDQASTIELYDDNVFGGAIDFSEWTTPEMTSDSIFLDPTNNGKPDKLSYQHDAEIYSRRIGFSTLKVCSGKVVAQQRVNGIWSDIAGSEYEQNAEVLDWDAGAYTWREVKDLQLDKNADAIRFKRFSGGAGHHNFKDIQISRLHYLRPTTDTIDLGDITIGEDRPATVGIEYSDIKKDLSTAKGNEEDVTYSVGESTIYLECGSFGHYDLPITIHPTELGPWSNTVIVKDKFTGDSVIIVVNANVVPEFIHTYEKPGEWGEQTHWKDDKKPGPNDDVRIDADVTIVSDITVNGMTIERDKTVTVNPGVTLTLRDGVSRRRTTYGNLHVKDGGKVVVGTGAFMINDFTLDASLGDMDHQAKSGQIQNDSNRFFVNGDAYFRINFDPNDSIPYGWYDFVVPFEVDVLHGIYDSVGTKLTNNVDYAIMEFSEERRAKNTGRPWIWFTGTMQPGKLYTITLDNEKKLTTFLLKKKDNLSALGNSSFAASYSNIGDSINRGWNGLGNSTLQYCQLNSLPATMKIQVNDHTNRCYVQKTAADYTYAVGTAFFVQVPDTIQSIDLTAVKDPRGVLAPARNVRSVDEFRLSLTAEGATRAVDNLWVSASEDAYADYTIGHDLLKMGEPSDAKIARMWAVRKDMRLCDIEMLMRNYSASCDINFQAPNAGTYVIAVDQAPADATLYLTKDGRVMWNLSMSPYEIDLQKGRTEGYGLRIVADRQTATGIENEGLLNSEKGSRKVLIDDKMYIITPDGAMYDALGKGVKF